MKLLESVNVGRPRQPAGGAVEIGPFGLQGIEQASLGRAVWAYPAEHHPFWQTIRAQAGLAEWGAPVPPVALGEDLLLRGLVEREAFVGDLLKFAGCTLAVSGPFLPDDTVNVALGFPHAARLMAQSTWSGFWLAVRVPGTIRPGEPFELVPGPREVGVTELFRARVDGD